MRSVYQHAPCGTGWSSAPKLPPILHGTSFHRDFVYLVQIRVMRLCFWCAPWTVLVRGNRFIDVDLSGAGVKFSYKMSIVFSFHVAHVVLAVTPVVIAPVMIGTK